MDALQQRMHERDAGAAELQTRLAEAEAHAQVHCRLSTLASWLVMDITHYCNLVVATCGVHWCASAGGLVATSSSADTKTSPGRYGILQLTGSSAEANRHAPTAPPLRMRRRTPQRMRPRRPSSARWRCSGSAASCTAA